MSEGVGWDRFWDCLSGRAVDRFRAGDTRSQAERELQCAAFAPNPERVPVRVSSIVAWQDGAGFDVFGSDVELALVCAGW